MKEWLKRQAISKSLRKPAPERIPLSGPRVRQRDYTTAHLVDRQGNDVFLVRRVTPIGYQGLWFEPGRPSGESGVSRELTREESKSLSFAIDYYCGEISLRFTSSLDYIFGGEIRAKTWRQWLRILKWGYDRKDLARHARIDVLHLLTDDFLENGTDQWHPFDVISLMYGDRWASHPDRDTVIRYYRTILQSLVNSGELTANANTSGSFRLSPSALSTLHEHETQEQRHRDMERQAKLMFVLTACLVFIGVVQAGAAVIDALKASDERPAVETRAATVEAAPDSN